MKKKKAVIGKKEIEEKSHATLLLLDGKTYYQVLLLSKKYNQTVQEYAIDAVREFVKTAVVERIKKEKERKNSVKLPNDREHTEQPSVQTLPSTIVEQTETR